MSDPQPHAGTAADTPGASTSAAPAPGSTGADVASDAPLRLGPAAFLPASLIHAIDPFNRLPRLRETAFGVGLLLLVLVASMLGAIAWLSSAYERSEAQARLQRDTDNALGLMRSRMHETEVGLRLLAVELQHGDGTPDFLRGARPLLDADQGLLRIEWRRADGTLQASVDAGAPRAVLPSASRQRPAFETQIAIANALAFERAFQSRSYYLQLTQEEGFEVSEVVVPLAAGGSGPRTDGVLLGVYSMPRLLTWLLPAEFVRDNQVWLADLDGTFIARAQPTARGKNVYRATGTIELPGTAMTLHANSRQGEPPLIPNLLAAWLVVLVLALTGTGMLLWRHVRLRLQAERALRAQHAFRKAMEDSLVTGLRARDLAGRITYVNPAFCAMVGHPPEALLGRDPPMPFWVPERREESERRHAQLLAGTMPNSGFESVFMRSNGERFPVLVFEAPLIDGEGRHTGWMSSVVDVSEQRRIEELNRRHQDTLQANARLAMLGEMATAVSHELNQPLAAISTYAQASENLLASGSTSLVTGALQSIRAQAERAAQVIRSIQQFVRRGALRLEAVRVDELVRTLAPLIELQARRIGVRPRIDVDPQAIVLAEPVLLEQVLLNLVRNAVEAMGATDPERRELRIEARRRDDDQVEVEVLDRGPGVDPQWEPKLFAAFASTKADGLGVGLSLCRSVIERLGGRLEYQRRDGGGSTFRFTLPAAGELARDGDDAVASALR